MFHHNHSALLPISPNEAILTPRCQTITLLISIINDVNHLVNTQGCPFPIYSNTLSYIYVHSSKKERG